MARMLIDNHGRAIPETCLTADQVAWMDSHPSSAPKTPLEAAIDKANGFKPGEEDGGAEAAEVRTVDETKPAADETKQAEVKENAAPVKEKRDWVKEAYECFLKGKPRDTEPLGVIRSFYEVNASEELKAKCKAEGKTPEGAFKFMKAVMIKAGGTSISDSVGLSICMHYFQDVPKDWYKVEKPSRREAASVRTEKGKTKRNGGKFKGEPPMKIDLKGGQHKRLQKEKERKAKAKKRGGEQGFFFDLMETETVGPDAAHGSAAGQDGKVAGDAE